MNNEEIIEKLNTDNNLLDTMESLIEEFSPKEILERGEIVDGTVISIQDNGLVKFVQCLDQRQLSRLDIVRFAKGDIERHDAVKEVLEIYGDM